MTRLVVVSNRVSDPGAGQAAGGLAVCLLDAMRDRGGLWFGWNGDLVAEEGDIAISCTKHGRCTLMTAPLSERDYREFYIGFSNEVL